MFLLHIVSQLQQKGLGREVYIILVFYLKS